jgi:hypothetical protein
LITLSKKGSEREKKGSRPRKLGYTTAVGTYESGAHAGARRECVNPVLASSTGLDAHMDARLNFSSGQRKKE